MSGMTLIIHLVGIIDQRSLLNHDCDRLIDHRTGDSIFEKRLFDGLLSESVFKTSLIGLTD